MDFHYLNELIEYRQILLFKISTTPTPTRRPGSWLGEGRGERERERKKKTRKKLQSSYFISSSVLQNISSIDTCKENNRRRF